MTWRNKSLLYIVLTLVITVSVLAGGQLIWHNLAVAKPLDKGLKQIAGVEVVVWDDNTKNDIVSIDITLSGVEDLQATYANILAAAQNSLGRKPFRVVIHDQRTAELTAFYHTIHFYVQEAIATGNFSAMAERIDSAARQAGVEAKVYVDDSRIYIQATDESGSLYEVVPRPSADREVK